MKEQKIVVCYFGEAPDQIQPLLNKGYTIVSAFSESVANAATDSMNRDSGCYELYGRICFILEINPVDEVDQIIKTHGK